MNKRNDMDNFELSPHRTELCNGYLRFPNSSKDFISLDLF